MADFKSKSVHLIPDVQAAIPMYRAGQLHKVEDSLNVLQTTQRDAKIADRSECMTLAPEVQLDITKTRGKQTSTTERKTKIPNIVSRKPSRQVKMQREVVNPNILFFFGYKMIFSNFYKCSYHVELPEPYGFHIFHSVEQLYMFRKAFYFRDHTKCRKILNAKNALSTKYLGSHIDSFVPEIWDKPKRDVMKECLVRKFTDSDKADSLTKQLISSPRVLIEASPKDRYWGIGFTKEEGPFVLQEDWGDAQNWLGRLLMTLQQFLVNMDSLHPNSEESQEYHEIHKNVQLGKMFTYEKKVYNARIQPAVEPFKCYLNRISHQL